MGGAAVPYTKAGAKATEKWRSENQDRIYVKLPKGEKQKIQDHAAARGESQNDFMKRAIHETMARDNETPEA